MRAASHARSNIRRVLIAVFIFAFAPFLAASSASAQDEAVLSALRSGGHAILLRHAATDGTTGDPPSFRLDDCSTQRNLSERGRRQAAAIGEGLRARSIPIARVLTSAWCRCRDTADLMKVGGVEIFTPINSAFNANRDRSESRNDEVRAFLSRWRGPGNVVLVTHQVNVTALTGANPREGEAVVVTPDLKIVGRLPAPQD